MRKGIHYACGSHIFETLQDINLQRYAVEYKKENPEATEEDFVKHVVDTGRAKLLDEHPGFAFKFFFNSVNRFANK